MRRDELLQAIQAELARTSALQHELAIRRSILADAQIQLRIGRSADVVSAIIGEQRPDLLEELTAA